MLLSMQKEERHAKCTAGGTVTQVTWNTGEGESESGNVLNPAQQSFFVVCSPADCWSGTKPRLFRAIL